MAQGLPSQSPESAVCRFVARLAGRGRRSHLGGRGASRPRRVRKRDWIDEQFRYDGARPRPGFARADARSRRARRQSAEHSPYSSRAGRGRRPRRRIRVHSGDGRENSRMVSRDRERADQRLRDSRRRAAASARFRPHRRRSVGRNRRSLVGGANAGGGGRRPGARRSLRVQPLHSLGPETARTGGNRAGANSRRATIPPGSNRRARRNLSRYAARSTVLPKPCRAFAQPTRN